MLDPTIKGVLQTDPYMMAQMQQSTAGIFSQRIRKEILYVYMCGIKFPHHHFTGIFGLKSQQLLTGGFISSFQKDLLSFSESLRFQHFIEEKSKVLNMKKLKPGFVIWAASLCVAFLALLLEWLITMKEYLVMKCVLLAFYRWNHQMSILRL